MLSSDLINFHFIFLLLDLYQFYFQFYEIFKLETPTGVPQTPKQSEPNHENEDAPKSPTGVNLSNPVGLLTRLSQHLKKRSYSVHVSDVLYTYSDVKLLITSLTFNPDCIFSNRSYLTTID